MVESRNLNRKGAMAFKCPGCGRPLYNRKRATCEFCSAPLPASLLLNAGQQARIEAMKQLEQRLHREVMSRDLPGGRGDGGFSGGGDFGGGSDSGGGGGDCG